MDTNDGNQDGPWSKPIARAGKVGIRVLPPRRDEAGGRYNATAHCVTSDKTGKAEEPREREDEDNAKGV